MTTKLPRRPERTARRRPRRPPPERGSAFLLSLLVLLLLAGLGLSLSLVAQTEMRIGGRERVVQRVFYAADSGLSASASRALAVADFAGRTYTLDDPGTPAALGFRHEVEVTPFVPIRSGPCNLCEINQQGQYGPQTYRRINHAVTSQATRLGGADARAVAEKVISTMVDVQPWPPSTESLLPLQDPEALAKIRF